MKPPPWLHGMAPLPKGGITLTAEYRTGRREGAFDLVLLDPLLARRNGSKNGSSRLF